MDEATLNTLLAGYQDELEELEENRRRRAAERAGMSEEEIVKAMEADLYAVLEDATREGMSIVTIGGEDEDYTPVYPEAPYELAAQVVQRLKESGTHISFAESCTGGLCAAAIVAVPDASWVLDASFVTYANEAKTALVGVREETLAAHGAVSEEVAAEMAAGAAHAAHSDVGVGISGIAGPTGGTPEKPVGTVCFGFSVRGRVTTATCHFGDLGRGAVSAAAVVYVLETLLKIL